MSAYVDFRGPPVPPTASQPGQPTQPSDQLIVSTVVSSPREATDHLGGRDVVHYPPDYIVSPACDSLLNVIAFLGGIILVVGIITDIACNVPHNDCEDNGRDFGVMATVGGAAGMLLGCCPKFFRLCQSIQRVAAPIARPTVNSIVHYSAFEE